MAFPNDLVRLAVSASRRRVLRPFQLTPARNLRRNSTTVTGPDRKGGEPFVLMEDSSRVAGMASQDLRQPAAFWQRLEEKIRARAQGAGPGSVRKASPKLLPKGAKPEYRM